MLTTIKVNMEESGDWIIYVQQEISTHPMPSITVMLMWHQIPLIFWTVFSGMGRRDVYRRNVYRCMMCTDRQTIQTKFETKYYESVCIWNATEIHPSNYKWRIDVCRNNIKHLHEEHLDETSNIDEHKTQMIRESDKMAKDTR
jgi:hypothetical protein